jgi:hypothetical protein
MLLLFSVLLALLFISRSAYGGGHCQHTQALPLTIGGRLIHVVRFNHRPCDEEFDHLESHPFCGGSGWGDEEASVVCRSELHSQFGIGGYVDVDPVEVGYSHVSCVGDEAGLDQCTALSSETMAECSQAGIIRQCLNVSQVFVSRSEDYESFEHVEVSEGETADFCFIVWGPLSEPLHVLVETTDSGHAVGKIRPPI